MNILHITTFLQGGAGRIIAELACAQARSGHRVTVVTSTGMEQDYGNYPEWIALLKAAGVGILFVNSTFKREISLNVAAFRMIKAKADCDSISVIHTHAAIPSLIALLLRSTVQHFIPIMQTMHGWGIKKSPEQEATDITLMSHLNRIITPSEASSRLLARLGVAPELVTVVPYGISSLPPVFENGRADLLKYWKSKGLRVLVCIGTVGARKNQRLILEAMAHSRAPKNVACAIVGEGEDISALVAAANDLQIGDRMHFFGYQPECAQFLSSADWLILPSNDEGLPLSILEAYRASIPVLGSNIPEIAEAIIPEQTGFLFQSGNAESLVQALARAASITENDRIRMGSAANKLWQQAYSLERMLDHYARIYRELVGRSQKPIL